jgi:RNA polymerase sigma factor (sigma-70 family)
MSWIPVSHELVRSAAGGNAQSLQAIVRETQDPIYNLALKFLWHPEDAQDAAQEILIRIITNLSGFRAESAYGTWAYRIAVNHLMNVKRSRAERREVSFKTVEKELAVLDQDALRPEEEEIAGQVKIACTHGMLLCLNRAYRMAFVIGTIFEIKSGEAAQILGISAESYRQRLARARKAMSNFLGSHCGLVNEIAACSCGKRVRPCARTGAIRSYLKLAENLKKTGALAQTAALHGREIAAMEKTAALYRSGAQYRTPGAVTRRLHTILGGKLFAD